MSGPPNRDPPPLAEQLITGHTYHITHNNLQAYQPNVSALPKSGYFRTRVHELRCIRPYLDF